MNIVCIDCFFANTLTEMGHTVFSPQLPAGFTTIPALLRAQNFKPDLFIQQERLGARVIFDGLDEIGCPTVFISIDAHLNMFWHKYYARLFDAVFTPHVSLYSLLPKAERHPRVVRFAPPGYQREFVPHASRSHELSFCGVIDEHRSVRKAMLQLLGEYYPGLYYPANRVSHSEMLDMFSDTRIIPNESISWEVNFRLFEGTSCGGLVISQNIGEDQDINFTPGKEIEVYDNGLELLDKISFYHKNYQAAERIAKAGWNRVQNEHLFQHRAQQLLDAATIPQARARGAEAMELFWLAGSQLARHGSHPVNIDWLMDYKKRLPFSERTEFMAFLLLYEAAQPSSALYDAEATPSLLIQLKDSCIRLLEEGLFEDSLLCNLVASVSSALQDNFLLAVKFWLRQQDYFCATRRDASRLKIPETIQELLLGWAEILEEYGWVAQPGFNFLQGGISLPQCAFECYLLAQNFSDPNDLGWITGLKNITDHYPGYSCLNEGFLAMLSLHNQEKWLLQLRYGVAAIKNMRIEAGIFELHEAFAKASITGDETSFMAELAASPGSSYILKALHGGRSI